MNCKWCGAEETWRFEHSQGFDVNFACESALRDSDQWIRGEPCQETELANLKSLLREVGKLTERVANLPDGGCGAIYSPAMLARGQAKALLSKIQKAVGNA